MRSTLPAPPLRRAICPEAASHTSARLPRSPAFIVMYEYAETLRTEEGLPTKEAAMKAGSRRMRPIFLTSATTALGVLPMIISRNPLWMPMGVVICFGVVLSMVIILAVMPVMYWQIFKKSKS